MPSHPSPNAVAFVLGHPLAMCANVRADGSYKSGEKVRMTAVKDVFIRGISKR